MRIELTYCAAWGYEPQALSLTGKILNEYKQKISDFKLIPFRGGAFEVVLDGNLIYSKLQTGDFPDENAILKEVGSRLKKK